MSEVVTTPIEVSEYFEKRSTLIKSIEANEMTFSFSSFSKFMDSPRHFLEYKLEERKPTAAMLKGEIGHCLVFEPDEFENRFEVKNIHEPSTELSTDFCNFIISGMDCFAAFEAAGYKRGNAEETQAKYQDYINMMLGLGDKRIITEKSLKQCEVIKNSVNFNDASKYVLNRITETEKGVEWEMEGLKWNGRIDGKGDRIKCDLKIVADADPRKMKYKIRDMKYDVQAALYNIAIDPTDDYFIIAADYNGHVSVIQITKEALNAARERIEESMLKLKQCIFLNKWDCSYDYFGEQSGIYVF